MELLNISKKPTVLRYAKFSVIILFPLVDESFCDVMKGAVFVVCSDKDIYFITMVNVCV